MKLRTFIALSAVAVLAGPASANWIALDGNRNPFSFMGLSINGVQEQQVSPSDASGNPYSQSNPQFFDLMLGQTLIGPGASTKALSVPMAPPTDPDIRPSPATITAADTLSTTNSGQNGASIVTGSPSANSFVTQAVNGASTIRMQLAGSWVGTLTFEQSIDGGVAYGAMACHINGTIYSASSVTGNGIFDCELAGATQFRVRATAFVNGGTAALTETVTSFPGIVKVLNPVAVKDNSSGAALTIKPASTPPAATDPAAVVALSQNTGEVGTPASGVAQPTGGVGLSGWLSGIYNRLSGSLTIAPLGVTSTDDSGTIATGGAYQQVIAPSGTRKGCLIQNPSTATEVLNVKFGSMASPYTLAPGQSIGCLAGSVVLQDLITATAATNGHAYAATAQ